MRGLCFGLYQSCENRGSVGRMSVFWLRWSGVRSVCVVSLDYLCRWQVQVSVYIRCAQCSILLHLIDI